MHFSCMEPQWKDIFMCVCYIMTLPTWITTFAHRLLRHMHVLVPMVNVASTLIDSVCINHLIRSYMDALNQRGLAYNSLLLLNLIYLMDAVWDES